MMVLMLTRKSAHAKAFAMTLSLVARRIDFDNVRAFLNELTWYLHSTVVRDSTREPNNHESSGEIQACVNLHDGSLLLYDLGPVKLRFRSRN